MQARLTATDLACRRGERLLFRGLSLDLKPSDVLHITGENGTGKTSLLQMLLLMKQTAAASDRRQVLNLGGDERSPVALGLVRDVLTDHDLTKPLRMPTRIKPSTWLWMPVRSAWSMVRWCQRPL